VKLLVDGNLCTGHGRCYALAPEVFSADDEGYSKVRDTIIDVAPEHAEAARFGMGSCPEGAISIEED
jgi:ferredoxin